jgi:hypothetical protein
MVDLTVVTMTTLMRPYKVGDKVFVINHFGNETLAHRMGIVECVGLDDTRCCGKDEILVKLYGIDLKHYFSRQFQEGGDRVCVIIEDETDFRK